MRGQFAKLTASLTAITLLAGCASNTKGSWACKAQDGVSCASIDAIDHDAQAKSAKRRGETPVIDGAGIVKWWDRAEGYAQPPIKGPRREGDQVMRVVVAPWVDAAGDYHGRSEIFAVMRKGAWWVAPDPVPLEPPPPPPTAPLKSEDEAAPKAAAGVGSN
jgi:conjugal transfer pilus assembly protein TraV